MHIPGGKSSSIHKKYDYNVQIVNTPKATRSHLDAQTHTHTHSRTPAISITHSYKYRRGQKDDGDDINHFHSAVMVVGFLFSASEIFYIEILQNMCMNAIAKTESSNVFKTISNQFQILYCTNEYG